MTIEEVANLYGTKLITPSSGQSITSIVRILYASDEPIFFKILTRLNHRSDWYNLDPEVPIKYLKPESVKNVSE